MPGPHQVTDWLLDLVIDTFLPTRCNNLSNSSSNTTKATNSLSTTNRELSTTILLRRNIIKW